MKKLLLAFMLLLVAAAPVFAIPEQGVKNLGEYPQWSYPPTYMSWHSPEFQFRYYPAALFYGYPHISYTSGGRSTGRDMIDWPAQVRYNDNTACKYAYGKELTKFNRWMDTEKYCWHTSRLWIYPKMSFLKPEGVEIAEAILIGDYI